MTTICEFVFPCHSLMKPHYPLLLRISPFPCHTFSFLDIFSLSLDRNRPAFRQKIHCSLKTRSLPDYSVSRRRPVWVGQASPLCPIKSLFYWKSFQSSQEYPHGHLQSIPPSLSPKNNPIGLHLSNLQRLVQAPACSTWPSPNVRSNKLLHALPSIWNAKTNTKINPMKN